MGLAGQQGQRSRRVGGIGGLAEDAAAERHRGVGAENGRNGKPRFARRRDRRRELGARHALDVGAPAARPPLGLERFGVFVGVGHEQHLVTHADLRQQLAAARALRGEIDEAE